MRNWGSFDALCAWLLVRVGDTSFQANELLKPSPLVAKIWSPVDGTFYLQETDKIFVNVGLKSTDAFEGIFEEANVCVRLSRLFNKNASSNDSSGFSFNSSNENSHLSLEREAMPQIGNRPECVHYGNGALDLPAYAVLDLHPGLYEVRFTVSDALFGFEISSTSTFYVRAKQAFQRAVLGAPRYLESQSVDTESGDSRFKATATAPRRRRKPVAVLAIKYGIHGDNARASVCVDGEIVLDVPLAQLFRTEALEVQRELAREQAQRVDLRESHGGSWALKPRDEEALSSHLALQAATGFADGCKGVRLIRRMLYLEQSFVLQLLISFSSKIGSQVEMSKHSTQTFRL